MAVATLASLGAIGCRLSISGAGPDLDDAASSAMSDSDGSDDASSGDFSFDATLGSSSSGGPVADGGHAVADSSRDARDSGSNDAANSKGSCQTLYTCCANLGETAFGGTMSQSCLQVARDGAAASCDTDLALLRSFSLCP
jgi:hypothetical protein